VLLSIAWPASGAINVERLDVQQPRSFGYQIGDRFERIIDLQLRKPLQLDPESLPAAGRLTVWLATAPPEVTQETTATSTLYHIRIVYQVVNIDAERTDIAVPHIDLRYTDGDETLKTLVPASRVNVSVLGNHRRGDLQPDEAPSLLPRRYSALLVYGAALAACLIALAYLYWGLPFSSASHPFGDAYRAIRTHRREAVGGERYHEVLQGIHSAFNRTAGKTVFAEKLDEFFTDHGQFEPMREPITDYFAYSRTVFFEDAASGEHAAYTVSDLEDLIRRCHDIERGLS